jgi:hypothetical protein
MDPYMEQVVNKIATQGNRNFSENILPQLESKFVGLGQYGSKRHGDLAARASRDVQSEISDRQYQAMSGGYQQAAQIFAADQARAIESARALSGVTEAEQAANFRDIAGMESVANQAQQEAQRKLDIGYEDWFAEESGDEQRLSAHLARMQGLPVSHSRTGYVPRPAESYMNTAGQLGNWATNMLGMKMQGSE